MSKIDVQTDRTGWMLHSCHFTELIISQAIATPLHCILLYSLVCAVNMIYNVLLAWFLMFLSFKQTFTWPSRLEGHLNSTQLPWNRTIIWSAEAVIMGVTRHCVSDATEYEWLSEIIIDKDSCLWAHSDLWLRLNPTFLHRERFQGSSLWR